MSPTKPNGAKGCPICGDPATPAYRPFCSTRCADIDLGKWLRGAYRAPAEEAEEPSAEEIARARAERDEGEGGG